MTNTYTLDDIRHTLAVEVRSLRRLNRMYSRAEGLVNYDPGYYRTVISYVSELGNGVYERPERKRRW